MEKLVIVVFLMCTAKNIVGTNRCYISLLAPGFGAKMQVLGLNTAALHVTKGHSKTAILGGGN